jgi:hypothetical protein
VCFVFLTSFLLQTSKVGNDVYAVSENIFEDLCVCWNPQLFYVGKDNLHS